MKEAALLMAALGFTQLLAALPHAAQAIVSPGARSARVAQSSLPAQQRIIVKFKPGADPGAVHNRIGRRLNVPSGQSAGRAVLGGMPAAGVARSLGLDRLQVAHLPEAQSLAQALALYREDPDVEYAEVDALLTVADTVPNDSKYRKLWGIKNIDAPRAWDVEQGDPSIVVAIIDSGLDYTHPDLAANMWVNAGEIPGNGVDDDGNGFVDDVHGYDFLNEDPDPIDDYGHGTHVAGTVGAVGNNGEGVVGVSWEVRLMALKFIGTGGSGFTSDAVRAVHYAISMGARVSNNSYGSSTGSEAMRDVIAAAREAGLLFVAAAGNGSDDTDADPHYPSAYDLDNVISVAALTKDDRLADFSNYGLVSVDLGAPGENIWSTMPTYETRLTFRESETYAKLSGTSVAAPHVAGAAALLLAADPSLRYDEVRARLLATADPLPGLLVATGGRLNVASAFAGLGIGDDPTAPASIVDLAVTATTHRTVTLSWTATGDDDDAGQAALYDVRYSNGPITEASWDEAEHAREEPLPLVAGAQESFVVDGLFQRTTCYLALKAIDEAGNYSPLSNVVTATTAALIPTAIAIDRGNQQIGPGSTSLPSEIGVVVTDAGGLGVSGVPVTFSVIQGPADAFASPGIVETNADGIASSTLTLGTVPPGTAGLIHRVSATAPGLPSVELEVGAHALIDLVEVFNSGPRDPWPLDVALGDADGDGRHEIVAALYVMDAAALRIYEAQGDNQIIEIAQFNSDQYSFREVTVQVADCDADGDDEIIAYGSTGSGAWPPTYPPLIIEGVADDQFQEAAHDIVLRSYMELTPDDDSPPQPPSPRTLSVADTNQNGRPELIFWYESMEGSGVSIWEHRGAPGEHDYEEIFTYETQDRAPGLIFVNKTGEAVGDSDADGRMEVVPGQREWLSSTGEGTGIRIEYNELTNGYDVKGGLDITSVFDPQRTSGATVVTLPATFADIDGDGVRETAMGGNYGCTCVVIYLRTTAHFYGPGPIEPCEAGNLAVFRTTGDDTYEPMWSNVGKISCTWGLRRDLGALAKARFNALPPGRDALVAGGEDDVEIGVLYALNPFPFIDELMIPMWYLPFTVRRTTFDIEHGDLDADGRPELIIVGGDSDGIVISVLEENLEVGGTNLAPVLDPIGPKVVSAGDPLVFTVSASDVNRDILTFSAGPLPAGADFDALRRAFSWTPTEAQVGDHGVTFEVSDGVESDAAAINIRVLRDIDGDGVADAPDPNDNCPTVANTDQADQDGDGVGDLCDNCPGTGPASQTDGDNDGVGDLCDVCPANPDPGQADADGDGIGDACDDCPFDAGNDADGDGLCGDGDNCPDEANAGQADGDGDGVGDPCDNCPSTPNSEQYDTDDDGVGDRCDWTVDACAGGNDALSIRRFRVRYGTGAGTKMTVKGEIGLALRPHLEQQGDVTMFLAGDAGPFLSARVPGNLFVPNRRLTSFKMKGDGSMTDGLTRVQFRESGTGMWRFKAKGAGLTTGADSSSLQVLLRVGDGCYATSPALRCELRGSGRSLLCESP